MKEEKEEYWGYEVPIESLRLVENEDGTVDLYDQDNVWRGKIRGMASLRVLIDGQL